MPKIDWMANVGSWNNPVSLLHEYAVGLIYDRIRYGLRYGKPVRLMTDNGISGDITRGASEVRVPDEWTAIGGFYPDLALYGGDTKPVRIIEVIVTSPPQSNKIDSLKKRGVDVVVTRKLRDQYDLLIMFGADRPFPSLAADNPKRAVVQRHMPDQPQHSGRRTPPPVGGTSRRGKIESARFIMMRDGSWGIRIIASRSYQPVVGERISIHTNRGDLEEVMLRKVVWRDRFTYPEYPDCDTILATISRPDRSPRDASSALSPPGGAHDSR